MNMISPVRSPKQTPQWRLYKRANRTWRHKHHTAIHSPQGLENIKWMSTWSDSEEDELTNNKRAEIQKQFYNILRTHFKNTVILPGVEYRRLDPELPHFEFDYSNIDEWPQFSWRFTSRKRWKGRTGDLNNSSWGDNYHIPNSLLRWGPRKKPESFFGETVKRTGKEAKSQSPHKINSVSFLEGVTDLTEMKELLHEKLFPIRKISTLKQELKLPGTQTQVIGNKLMEKADVKME